MKVYFDTGILLKSYVFEADSPQAIALIDAAGEPVVFSHVHQLEIPNAIRLKRFRGEITKQEETKAIRAFQADIDAQRLVRPDYDLAGVFFRAEELSARYSALMGTRSLDVLHVAAALQCGCTVLGSFDERQRKLAMMAGLQTLPAKSRKR